MSTTTTTTTVPLERKVLNENDRLAAELRAQFAKHGIRCLNLISSPGSGKTALLERTLGAFDKAKRVAVLTGDIQTDADAQRLARYGFPVRQITTAGACHLDARMVSKALQGWDLASLDLLFIENVGNLVCPSSYDLGEKVRVALLSVTEGEDKPLKYPTLFNSADAAVITKIDIAEPCGFDRATALGNIHEIRPGIRIFETSAKTGAGMAEWLNYLAEERAKRIDG